MSDDSAWVPDALDPTKLAEALQDFEGKGSKEMRARLKEALTTIDLSDLEEISDETLLETTDTVAQSRLAYVISLRRLVEFLRARPRTWDQAEAQARFALGYIKHAESSGLAASQMGRRKGDEELAALVVRLREETMRFANIRARREASTLIEANTPREQK